MRSSIGKTPISSPSQRSQYGGVAGFLTQGRVSPCGGIWGEGHPGCTLPPSGFLCPLCPVPPPWGEPTWGCVQWEEGEQMGTGKEGPSVEEGIGCQSSHMHQIRQACHPTPHNTPNLCPERGLGRGSLLNAPCLGAGGGGLSARRVPPEARLAASAHESPFQGQAQKPAPCHAASAPCPWPSPSGTGPHPGQLSHFMQSLWLSWATVLTNLRG